MPAVNTTPPILNAKDIQRFWNHVDKTPGQGPQGECWQWTGGRQRYGRFKAKRREYKAHRIAYFLARNVWSDLLTCHHCDNMICCNVSHMFLGTHADNMADRDRKGRKPTGVNSGSYKHPERRPRGVNHWRQQRPELVPRGETSGTNKLTEQSVRTIRRLYAEGYSAREIAPQFGVHRVTVNYVIQRRTWKHI